MSHVIKTYNEDLRESIRGLWSEAIQSRDSTLADMEETARKFLAVGEVVDKAKQSHPQDVFRFLDDIMSPREIQSVLSLRQCQLRRGGKLDKAQLQKMGLLEQQELNINHHSTASKPTVISTFAKFSGKMAKAVQSRPVADMTPDEREQTLAVLRPIEAIINQLKQ